MYGMHVTYLDTSVHAQLHHVYTYKQSKCACIFAYICTRIASPPGHRHVGAHKFWGITDILTLSRTHLHTYSYSLSPSVPTLSLSFLSLSLSNKQTNTRTHTHTQPYHRGDGVSTQRTFAAPPPYFTEGKDQVRALINRIKLPGGGRGAPDHVRNGNARNKNAAEAPRRSADGAVKMGGGFCYKSNIDIDYTRPTPSRPTYSHGLFLFPFSNENATKMLDVAKEYSHELDPSHSASHPGEIFQQISLYSCYVVHSVVSWVFEKFHQCRPPHTGPRPYGRDIQLSSKFKSILNLLHLISYRPGLREIFFLKRRPPQTEKTGSYSRKFLKSPLCIQFVWYF